MYFDYLSSNLLNTFTFEYIEGCVDTYSFWQLSSTVTMTPFHESREWDDLDEFFELSDELILSTRESLSSALGSSFYALERVDTWATSFSSDESAERVRHYRPARLPLYLLYKRLNVPFDVKDEDSTSPRGVREPQRRGLRRPLSASATLTLTGARTSAPPLPQPRVLVPLLVHHRRDSPHPLPLSASGRSEPPGSRAEENESNEELELAKLEARR